MRIFQSLAVASILSLTASHAFAFVVVREYTFDISSAATPWENAINVPYYDPSEHGGLELQEVVFRLEGSASSEFDVTAAGAGVVTVIEGSVGAFIRASGTISGLELDVLPSGTFAPPTLTVPGGTMQTLTNVSGSDSDTMLMQGVDVNPFVGAGEYVVNVDSIGTSNLTTSGGNWDASQRTDAGARFTVTYAVVPEPAAAVLLLCGLCGLILAWRRYR